MNIPFIAPDHLIPGSYGYYRAILGKPHYRECTTMIRKGIAKTVRPEAMPGERKPEPILYLATLALC